MKAIQDFLAKPNKTIREHSDDLKKRVYYLKEIGYIKGERLFYLLLECCKHHDDGKANFSFQRCVSSKRWIPFDPEKEIPHNVLSVYYLDKTQYEEMDYLKIASAILYHHDYCDEDRVINEKWMLIDENLLEGYSSESLSGDEIEYLMNEGLYGENLIILKGLLRRCDYSASGEYEIEYPNDFLLEKLERMMQRWKEKNENAGWNELQKFAIENRETDIIAVASTGMGKTEAGLLWIGDQKGFFILPVRTAINAIYDRVREEILQEEKLEERVALLHSEALEYYNDNVDSNTKVTGVYNGEDGTQGEFTLTQSEPGKFEANVPLSELGFYNFNIRQQDGENITSTYKGAFALKYSDEYKFNTNSVKLDSLVSETDGNFINKPEEVFEGKLEKEYKKINLTNLLLILALILFLSDIAYRRLNLDFSKYIKIGIRNKKKKTNEKNFVKKELAVEKDKNDIKTPDISNDNIKDKVNKKEKKPKVKKKSEEKSKPKAINTSELLKKKKDRNGI